MKNTFWIVSTPIGNHDDITVRAVSALKECSFIVCEEEKEYKALFSRLGIPVCKFIVCNEHHEQEAIDLTLELLKKGEKGALISDCGTPLFEDPGYLLINRVRQAGYRITALPGANSVVTALSLSPFQVKDFYFAGFLPKKKEEKESALVKLIKRKEPVILFEAPYRLTGFLELLQKHLKNRRICLFYDLTMETEQVIWGTVNEVLGKISREQITKGEYLVLLEGI